MSTENKIVLNQGEYCFRFKGFYSNSNQWTSWKYYEKIYSNIKRAKLDFFDMKIIDDDFKSMITDCRRMMLELLDSKDNVLCSTCIGKDH